MNHRFIKIILLLLAIAVFPAVFATDKPTKRVLVIYSFSETLRMPFAIPFRRLLNESPYKCDFTILKLRHQDGTGMTDWHESLAPLLPDIKAGRFDAIITLGDQAYQLLCDYAGELPHATPLVFSRVMIFDGLPQQHLNTTGNTTYLAPGATAELALRLFPDRKNLILVTNGTWPGRYVEKRMRVFMRNHPSLTLTTVRGEEMSSSEAVQAVRQLENSSILLYFGWFDKDTQKVDLHEDLLNQIRIKSTIPIFKLLDLDLPQYGIIGGVIGESLREAGIDAAERLIRIFDGNAAREIPVAEFETKTVINHGMLKVFGISEDLIPRHAVFLGKKESFWTAYQYEIIFSMTLITAALLISVLFLVLFLMGRRSAYRGAQILKLLPLRFMAVDEKGEILYYCMGEYEHEYEKLRTLDDFKNNQIAQLIREKVHEVLSTGERIVFEFKEKDTHRSAIVSALPDSLFNRKAVVWISQDVTALMETQIKLAASRLELIDALKQAQDANKTKSYFLATISHEIRTPLNAVIGFSELLKNGKLPKAEEDEYLDAINLAGNSLLSLINDVLDLSKLEAEQIVITPSPTDLGELLCEIKAIFQYKVQQKKLFFHLAFPPEIPHLKLDGLRLRQILLNLIGNAVKFTEKGGITLTADFRKNDDNDRGTLSIRVEDTGIGIAPEVQEQIFEPFVQGDALRDTHVYHGTGLGLSISMQLAQRMEGQILLESKIGRGSCFTLMLKNVETTASPDERTSEPATPAANPGENRVLLVDDVQMNLKVLKAMLSKLGVESTCARSGQEALDILRKDPDYTMVMTDFWMPGMEGAELARRIHENPATARIPIVVVTADAQMPEEKARIFQGILLKPLNQEALLKILRRCSGE